MTEPLKILVIEDNEADFKLVERCLREHGLATRCRQVDNLQDLQDALEKKRWDAVLCDYRVPQMSFLECFEILQAHLPDAPVILVSGSIGEEKAVELLKLGVWGFVLKDNLGRLSTLIQRSLREVADRQARRAAESALRASETRYRRLFEAAQDGILILNAETGAVEDVNPFLACLVGFTKEQILRKKVWELGCFHNLIANQEKFAELQRDHYVRYEGLPLETAGGRRVEVEFVSNVYEENGVNVIQCNIRDISERARAEKEVRRLNAELEQRVHERTAELEAFSYSVSHDLRAPLRAIDGYSQILIEEYDERLDEEGRRVLRVVRSEAQRMSRLIDELLAFSRVGRQALEPCETDMHSLVETTYKEAMAIEPGRKIAMQIGALPTAAGEPGMLRQVWANLLGNAVKFTRHAETALIQFGATQENGETIYFVRDNGAGFDMKHADMLFGIFRRLHGDKEFEGTGVGLAFVKRIIQRHGGRVWAEGAVNQGATFYFALPYRSRTKTSL